MDGAIHVKRQLLKINREGNLWKHLEGLGHLAGPVAGEQDTHLCVHLAHRWVDILTKDLLNRKCNSMLNGENFKITQPNLLLRNHLDI